MLGFELRRGQEARNKPANGHHRSSLSRSSPHWTYEPNCHNGNDACEGTSPVEPAKHEKARRLEAGKEPETAERRDSGEDEGQYHPRNDPHDFSLPPRFIEAPDSPCHQSK